MKYTDNGKLIKSKWLPLAMAHGVEWMNSRRPYADRFDNLYRGPGLKWALWYLGALIAFCFRVGAAKKTPRDC